MPKREHVSVRWVILTLGNRPCELGRAVRSLVDDYSSVVVVSNGAGPQPVLVSEAVEVVELAGNLGVPGGRHEGARATDAEIVAFLDDDAVAPDGATGRIRKAFAANPRLGAVSLKLIDEAGETSRRHVPRPGGRDADVSGEVALFLGGACALRREAYDDVGGYFTELFYGHEELELSWRLVDRGWSIEYLADVEVFHPRTEIERHAQGWELTGRNRVWIARRTLPWAVALVHVTSWLLLGAIRAPKGESRRRYLAGWRSGWKANIDRDPIRWRTVWKLTRLGRPPVL